MTTTHRASSPVAATPLWSVLTVTFLVSLGTGVFWNAIGFIAKHGYDFSQARTLVLYLVMGVVYTIGASRAGRITRWCERWVGPRTLLAMVILIQSLLCVLPVVTEHVAALWIAVAGAAASSSIIWPLVESYMSAGRHGQEMRGAIGWFNLVWMSAVGVPLLLMPPILAENAEWAVGGQAVANALALVPLFWFRASPGHHDPAIVAEHVGGEYPLLLRCARILLPMSYVLNAALSPILPYRFEEIGAAIELETPATATWMYVRVAAMVVMWRVGFWHGRWGTLLLAGVTMTGGFAVVILAPTMAGVLAGLTVFGVGMGMSYYAALYYAMAVGHAQVDASGTHEALIGAGYSVGPAAGLVGAMLGGGAAIVGIVSGVVGIGAAFAWLPYRVARRRRRAARQHAARTIDAP
ncbi:MAG: hypothetical protein HKO59_13850 [Phycisphaerales bacterium]|nr:hypothetical protein [Phycisphaerae bacterium]NNF42715.1 hypothetical protein [Phycisphaerales bacterium]NNM27044.1 hypothetical protein [Phycisphaerales bacterium]